MPDEHTQWERVSARSAQKNAFQPRQRTDQVRRVRSKRNPYRDEAERDRLLMRWVIAVIILLICIGVLIWRVFFA
jgi:hypothetical protein